MLNWTELLGHDIAGYYGSNDTASLNESSPTGRDYLAEVCRDWEAAAENAQTARTVIVRTGVPAEGHCNHMHG